MSHPSWTFKTLEKIQQVVIFRFHSVSDPCNPMSLTISVDDAKQVLAELSAKLP
jgi:hypothetical protein